MNFALVCNKIENNLLHLLKHSCLNSNNKFLYRRIQSPTRHLRPKKNTCYQLHVKKKNNGPVFNGVKKSSLNSSIRQLIQLKGQKN